MENMQMCNRSSAEKHPYTIGISVERDSDNVAKGESKVRFQFHDNVEHKRVFSAEFGSDTPIRDPLLQTLVSNLNLNLAREDEIPADKMQTIESDWNAEVFTKLSSNYAMHCHPEPETFSHVLFSTFLILDNYASSIKEHGHGNFWPDDNMTQQLSLLNDSINKIEDGASIWDLMKFSLTDVEDNPFTGMVDVSYFLGDEEGEDHEENDEEDATQNQQEIFAKAYAEQIACLEKFHPQMPSSKRTFLALAVAEQKSGIA